MSEDIFSALAPGRGEAIDPVEMARRDLVKKLPTRFYKTVGLAERDGGLALTLDGRSARTPARNERLAPTRAIADAMVGEWDAVADRIDPAAMPVTRLVNIAIDGVAAEMAAVRADVVKYAGSDLLCYRAGEPDSLARAQAEHWDPVLAWAREVIGARFILSQGVMFVAQPESAIAAVAAAVERIGEPHRMAALSSMTSLTGSALLALAVAHRHLSPDEAWAAAHVDEDFQTRNWGEDAEAKARRAGRWLEMRAAALVAAA